MTTGPLTAAREVQELFDAKAVTWPAKYAPDGPLASRLASMSAGVRGYARAGGRILDLGCGTGELARALAASGLRVTGCDISAPMLARAAGASVRGGSPEWVRLEPGWRDLPFGSATFDVVVASSVLEYVAEPDVVLRECTRVLRPGGVALYTVPDLRHPIRWAEWLARRLDRMTGARLASGRPARWHGYHAYLRTSAQRHRLRWWRAASRLAGLDPLPCPSHAARSTLRLLAFRKVGGSSAQPVGDTGGRP